LVFVTIPETIHLLPALQSLFAVIFFITVFFLAIDSAMSLVEAVGVALRDKFKNLRTEILTLIVVVVLGISSLLYTFGN
jgi:NSS family neurotransmitter:Na+ symporter